MPALLAEATKLALLSLLALGAVGAALLARLDPERLRLPEWPIAVCIGYAVVMPLALFEARFGPWLSVAVVLTAAVALVTRGMRDALQGAKQAAVLLAVAAAAVVLGVLVSGDDLRVGGGGISLRLGFDVVDKVFYAAVAEELRRAAPWQLQNPCFATVPLQYSLFPSAAALWLQRLGGVPLLPIVLVHLPALGLALSAATAAVLARTLAPAARHAPLLAAILVTMGGDLSALVEVATLGGLERTSPFFAFHAFGAQSLHYNPWSLGLPLMLSGMVLGARYLEHGGRGRAVLAGLVIGSLWETKVFALLVLVAGAAVAAALMRRPRLAALALLSLAGAAPWIALTLASASGRAGAPFALAPLALPSASLAANVTLRRLFLSLRGGAPDHGRVWVAGAVVTIAWLVGAAGVRLAGLGAWRRRILDDDTGVWTWLTGCVAVGLGAALVLTGDPVPVDAAQFGLAALFLAWIPAAVALSTLAERGRAGVLAVAALLLLAVSADALYVGRKRWPEAMAVRGPGDRLYADVDPDSMQAVAWLAANTPETASVLLPLHGVPAASARSLLLAALCGRRTVAGGADYSIAATEAEARRRAVLEVYGTTDGVAAVARLDALGVRWLWEEPQAPLRFSSPRLRLAFAAGAVRVWAVQPAS